MFNNLLSIVLLRSSYSSGSSGLYIFLVVIAIGIRIFRLVVRNSSGSGNQGGVKTSSFNPAKMRQIIEPTSSSCPHCGEHLSAKATTCPACYKLVSQSYQNSQPAPENEPERLPASPRESFYASPEEKEGKQQRTCPNCGVPVKRWAKHCNSCYENF